MKRVTNKEKIKKYFLELNGTDGVQANEIADELGMKRNAASALLNELTREGFLKRKKQNQFFFLCGVQIKQSYQSLRKRKRK